MKKMFMKNLSAGGFSRRFLFRTAFSVFVLCHMFEAAPYLERKVTLLPPVLSFVVSARAWS